MLRPRITKSLAVVSNQLPELPSVEPEVKRIDSSDPNYHPSSKSLATGKAYIQSALVTVFKLICVLHQSVSSQTFKNKLWVKIT